MQTKHSAFNRGIFTGLAGKHHHIFLSIPIFLLDLSLLFLSWYLKNPGREIMQIDSHLTRSAHIDTGRGLAIYRNTLVQLFQNYGQTHFLPTLNTIFMTFAYYSLSNDLGGGTLPMIMIYVLCIAGLVAPQAFNPTIRGATIRGT